MNLSFSKMCEVGTIAALSASRRHELPTMLQADDPNLWPRIFLRSMPGNHCRFRGAVKVQAAAILETALLPQGLKFVVFLDRLLRHMARLGLVRRSGTLLVLGLFLPLLVENDTVTFFFHGWHSFGRQRGG
jgi:hypothetical protein